MPSHNSHRGDMIERLIRILLLLAEGPHTQSELAAKCGVNGVTIRRDINHLTPHYRIEEDWDGREKLYRFGEGYKYTPPNFTPAELATLLLAQQTIATTGLTSFGTPFAGYGSALLAKVRSALPKDLRSYLDTLANIFGTAITPAKDFSRHAETIDKLTKAATASRRVRMRYQSLTRGGTLLREYDPYAVYFDPDGATLKTIGFDHKNREIRAFSIDHIHAITETTETFTRPPDFTLRGYLSKHCFNGIHGEPITVRLRAYGVTARIFAERKFHDSQTEIEPYAVAPDGEESITIEMRVARGRGLERFILSWMPFIEVVSPEELRAKVNDELRNGLVRNGGE
jgi:predicted DNA-binding transcriptional regulator YafY